MCDNDWTPYRKDFEEAATVFGWRKIEVEVQHERDWNETVWLNSHGDRLFSDNDLEEGHVKELIKIGQQLKSRGNS